MSTTRNGSNGCRPRQSTRPEMERPEGAQLSDLIFDRNMMECMMVHVIRSPPVFAIANAELQLEYFDSTESIYTTMWAVTRQHYHQYKSLPGKEPLSVGVLACLTPDPRFGLRDPQESQEFATPDPQLGPHVAQEAQAIIDWMWTAYDPDDRDRPFDAPFAIGLLKRFLHERVVTPKLRAIQSPAVPASLRQPLAESLTEIQELNARIVAIGSDDEFDWMTPAQMQSLPEPRYYIPGILREDQPMIVGGKSKTMKTSVTLDLAIALATKTPFLGRHEWTPAEAVRVGLMSGESGREILRDYGRRICNARGKVWDEIDDNIRVSAVVPRFADTKKLAKLERWLIREAVRVLIIDPTYFAMPSDNSGILAAQSEALNAILQTCRNASATLLLVHHLRKSAGNGKEYLPPTLDDLTGAGFAEFCGQWLLLGRREAYRQDYRHAMWFNHGMRGGDCGEHTLDIRERPMIYLDPTSRCWEVAFGSSQAARDEMSRRSRVSKHENAEGDKRFVLAAAAALQQAGRRISGNAIQRQPQAPSRERINAAIEALMQQGRLAEISSQQGYRLVAA